MKGIRLFFLLILVTLPNVSWKETSIKRVSITANNAIESKNTFESRASSIYKNFSNSGLEYTVFQTALKGYYQLKEQKKLQNKKYLTIIDFSQSSSKERMFVIDIEAEELVHQSLVAHGRNSGLEYASKFSNRVNSHQSSLGFYTTAETYTGKHGFSLRLDGLEYSNNNARRRAIVIHSADYAGKDFVKRNGRLGRSYGCPSLPKKGYQQVISKIKDGSCLFIYYPQKTYLSSSKLVNTAVDI